jgi:hypothetical protein
MRRARDASAHTEISEVRGDRLAQLHRQFGS